LFPFLTTNTVYQVIPPDFWPSVQGSEVSLKQRAFNCIAKVLAKGIFC
jgi:hypothetical protein